MVLLHSIHCPKKKVLKFELFLSYYLILFELVIIQYYNYKHKKMRLKKLRHHDHPFSLKNKDNLIQMKHKQIFCEG
jgi:hypothetical protein